jgi:hypothetical protein
MVISFFEDIFPYEKFPVEFECYKQLKNCNDVNYIAVPWTQILNGHWLDYPNKQPADFYFKALSKYKIQQDNNFTVCQHDSYMLLKLYFSHLNITKVFSPLHEAGNSIPGINVIPIPFTSSFNFKNVKKDINFSFVGTYTSHPMRVRMKSRLNGSGIIYRDSYHVDSNVILSSDAKKEQEQEYQDILQRSRYSLCPRGSSVSSVRFWESLHAQAIPILISDNWVLPNWDWDNTIVRIKEEEFERMSYEDIENVLKDISTDREQVMKLNCARAYDNFKPSNFEKYIRSHL